MSGAQKTGIVVVYTGAGKGKTSASLGLVVRALGAGMRVAYIQFIKSWQTNEDRFLSRIAPEFRGQLFLHKGGRGFYRAGSLSAAEVSDSEHRLAARHTYTIAHGCVSGGDYRLVVCDEANTAAAAGLLTHGDLEVLIHAKAIRTHLCLTGRGFPPRLISEVDIATDMRKLKHHFDDGFIASPGIDY